MKTELDPGMLIYAFTNSREVNWKNFRLSQQNFQWRAERGMENLKFNGELFSREEIERAFLYYSDIDRWKQFALQHQFEYETSVPQKRKMRSMEKSQWVVFLLFTAIVIPFFFLIKYLYSQPEFEEVVEPPFDFERFMEENQQRYELEVDTNRVFYRK